ncbi:hypothetical protein AURDEDRAFT_122672 [Auricularia subglabra TFB-10046 SS5]|nr:hypothetical protein AURDEDRAFT_122672 [Auricularia subglabra TFB-10046 SS5]
MEHSIFFRNMLVDGKPVDGESTSEDKPLDLPGLTARQFELMLDFVYFRYPGPTVTVYEALILLQLSDKFIMPTVRDFALKVLDYRLIPPILRLHYGVKCHVEGWVERAYRELIWLPINRILTAHLAVVDPQLMLDVIRTKAQCEDFRRSLYLDPPTSVHDPECFSRAACIAAWKFAFRTGFCLHYLNPEPDIYLSPALAAEKIQGIEPRGMHSKCLELTKAALIHDGAFEGETRILHAAMNAACGRGSTEPTLDAADMELMALYNARTGVF